jgi:hypothetical protein
MRNGRFTSFFIVFVIMLSALVSSCEKDPTQGPSSVAASMPDTVKQTMVIVTPGNYLAASGVLTIKIKDSTYTFDASRDSIAFINVNTDDKNRYFGITAINKEHTMSFGISSPGFANSNVTGGIAGGQLLLTPDANKTGLQYSLSRYTGQKDFGSINMVQYNQGVVLAKGTFFTFLATDDKANTPFYRVEGSFELQLK